VSQKKDASMWINEYDCALRKRIGHLMPEQDDVWWSLDDPDAAATAALIAVEQSAIPWLDSLTSRGAILRAYEEKGRHFVGLPPAADRVLLPVRAILEDAE
jgi:hypothetical protein